ncbi:hypothetical protein [Rhizobium sp. Leaf383]|uniref:DUF6950 family protein n=1 Tax=Rhizobium sp. Leaf383 TaxID=1736357 RepID=UPI00071587DE|nr:hypothetical protein [Rhizobium sp. Leaf383]KQS86934.1 hypothetical protein ASG58_01415 [Rhizobium sp. Leaf383]
MLETFLAEASRSPLIWGVNDCAMMLANWWMHRHGVDPALHLRGVYSTELECLALVGGSGGILALVDQIASRTGARPVAYPIAGDIGVIEVHGQQFAAIMAPTGRWMVKASRGMAGYRCGHLKAWSV